MESDQRPVSQQQQYHGLEQGSYTVEKLRHASADHVHITNRRFFIGPIPKNWLQSHRKSWYKTRIKFGNYTSKAATFSAASTFALGTEPSPAPEEDEPDREQRHATEPEPEPEIEPESSGREAAQSNEGLRILSHPLGGDHEDPTSGSDAADSSPLNEDGRDGTSTRTKHEARSAYYTAREWNPTASSAGFARSGEHGKGRDQGQSAAEQSSQMLNTSSEHETSQQRSPATSSDAESTAPLLGDRSRNTGKGKQPSTPFTASDRQEHQGPQVPQDTQEAIADDRDDEPRNRLRLLQDPNSRLSKIATRYNLDDDLLDKQQRIMSRMSRTQSVVPQWLHRRKTEEGEVIKAEKMLVRVEETMQKNLPDDYSEFDSLGMETRVQDSWREFLVVCRSASDKRAPFILQMYKTRVIPKIQSPDRKVSASHEIPLGRKTAKVNLYSSLDKTIAVWRRSATGTNIYILRPKSTADAVEWYTFINYTLGRHRASSLLVNVPDLDVSLFLKNPFAELEVAHDGQKGEGGITQSGQVQQSACLVIIRSCMKVLENRPEWSEVLRGWSTAENMGLVWKRYDRLEWVYGPNEDKMYGTIAMQGTHELELRPRQHYDTFISCGSKREEEPMPVEGFLIRLTSQRGVHQRMNKIFVKRVYLFSQDHYLFFCKPSQALPPAPPRLRPRGSDIPSTQEILEEMPLSYEIDPFPMQDGQISWLSSGNAEHLKQHDADAYAQLRRNTHNLSNADGFISLCRVKEIRRITDSCCRDFNPNPESDEEVDFEMLLDNGLTVRFRAYNSTTRDEWMKRLDELVKYWKARTAADAAELKAIRQRNLEILGIDEGSESVVGQFANKWEVKKAEASPLLHNMCSLVGCRLIKMSGLLYKKPRRHATFKRVHVVLTSGKLLVYHSSLRKQSGAEVPHIHHNLESTIELDNCYIYSGLLTESDLLYSNQTFDSNHPGHGTLPRVYLSSDLYTSSDEDTAITFVIWQPLQKNLFRARELDEKGQTRQTLKQVSKLGVHGRTIVFKTRSRVEKDRWVLSIASEIDRLQEGKPEDVRLTSS